jgi:hypothetical protein
MSYIDSFLLKRTLHGMVYVITSMGEVGVEKFEICFSGKKAKF